MARSETTAVAGLRPRTERILALVEQERTDAFFGGVCCALSAAIYMDDGTHPGYVAAVEAVGVDELLAYAKRERDIELPRIRQALRVIRGREAQR